MNNSTICKFPSQRYVLDTKEKTRDCAFQLIEILMKNIPNINHQTKPFLKEQIFFYELPLEDLGTYIPKLDVSFINITEHYNLYVILHELIHAFSGKKRHNGRFEAFSQSLILNEGFTELMTYYLIKKYAYCVDLYHLTNKDKKDILKKLRYNTAEYIGELRKEYFQFKKERSIQYQMRKKHTIAKLQQEGFDEDKFIDFDELPFRKEILFKKSTINLLIKKILAKYKINVDILRNNNKKDSYMDIIFLFEKIIYKLAEFYKKTPDDIFTILQGYYFNGEYDKFIGLLKEVFGNFDEKILETGNVRDITDLFGFKISNE